MVLKALKYVHENKLAWPITSMWPDFCGQTGKMPIWWWHTTHCGGCFQKEINTESVWLIKVQHTYRNMIHCCHRFFKTENQHYYALQWQAHFLYCTDLMLLIDLCFHKSHPNLFCLNTTLLWHPLSHQTAIYGLNSLCLVNIKDIVASSLCAFLPCFIEFLSSFISNIRSCFHLIVSVWQLLHPLSASPCPSPETFILEPAASEQLCTLISRFSPPSVSQCSFTLDSDY